MIAEFGKPAVLALTAFLLSTVAMDRAQAQPAPVPRAVVPADAAPEAMSDLYSQLQPGDNPISIEGAQWLQLKFAGFELGPTGALTITDQTGQSQTFTQEQLEAWEGLTAVFNGSRLTVTLKPGESAPGQPDAIMAHIEQIVIGLPAAATEGVESAAPPSLRNLLGGDLGRFIPPDPPQQEGALDGSPETICGAADNRVASSHPLTGRIMPIGCTGWIIEGGALLTAGHCIGANTQTVEFNVPASLPNGTTQAPGVLDQYRVVASSIVSANTGIGNDWAMFRVLPNTQTGLTPIAAQGGAFQVSNTANPANVRVTGYGVDGPPPNFGNPPPRDATNQTQQTHAGALTANTVGGPNSATLRHTADTQGGNSGSPVIIEGGGNVAIGIHTNGGCTVTGGDNAGTSFRNQGLWAVAGNVTIGQPQPVINNLAYEAGGWRVDKHPRMLGDVNGDGRDDIVAFGDHHVFVALGQADGTIGQPQPVINNLAYEAGGWRVDKHPRMLGDVNGDGRDDIVAFGDHHVFVALGQADGTIGQPQPVINNLAYEAGGWRVDKHPRMLGDVNGDGRDDIVAFGDHHVFVALGQADGTIGQPQPVIDNLAYEAGGWRVDKHPRMLGDVNGDGRDDIVAFGDHHVFVALGQADGTIGQPQPVIDNLAYEAGGWRVDKHPRMLGDVNGDGRDDIVAFGDHHVFVALGQADGTIGQPQPVINNLAYEAGGWRVDKHPRMLGDVNGDGRDDIVAFGDHHVFVALGQADGTIGQPQPVIDNLAYEAGGWRVDKHPRMLGDVNGDGHDDIVAFGDHHVFVALGQAGAS